MSNEILNEPIRFTGRNLAYLMGSLTYFIDSLDWSDVRRNSYDSFLHSTNETSLAVGEFFIMDASTASMAAGAIRKFTIALIAENTEPSLNAKRIATDQGKYLLMDKVEANELFDSIRSSVSKNMSERGFSFSC
jgi:hypothetical protein